MLMDTPKKPDKKKGSSKSKTTGVKKPDTKPADPKANFSEEDEEFDLPIDELDSFDNFNEFDEEEDY
jgi:hypothetical protein